MDEYDGNGMVLPHLAIDRPDLLHLAVRHWVATFITKFHSNPPQHPPALQQSLIEQYGSTYDQHPLFPYITAGYVRSVVRFDTIASGSNETPALHQLISLPGLIYFEGVVTYIGPARFTWSSSCLLQI